MLIAAPCVNASVVEYNCAAGSPAVSAVSKQILQVKNNKYAFCSILKLYKICVLLQRAKFQTLTNSELSLKAQRFS